VPALWQPLPRLFPLVASAHNLLQLKGMADRQGFESPVQVRTVNFRISARGDGQDPAKGQRRQSSATSGFFESSIDNRLRTGEKQATKKDFDPAIGKATRWQKGQASPNPGRHPRRTKLSDALVRIIRRQRANPSTASTAGGRRGASTETTASAVWSTTSRKRRLT
jgi:hypothetical protein